MLILNEIKVVESGKVRPRHTVKERQKSKASNKNGRLNPTKLHGRFSVVIRIALVLLQRTRTASVKLGPLTPRPLLTSPIATTLLPLNPWSRRPSPQPSLPSPLVHVAHRHGPLTPRSFQPFRTAWYAVAQELRQR